MEQNKLPALLNDEGQPMSEQEIKAASANWSAEQWESYLQSLEKGLVESQPEPVDIYRNALAANVFDIAPATSSDALIDLLSSLIARLSDKQKFVIEKYFFEGQSERQISRMLLVSRARVRAIKKRALRHLKFNAGKVVPSFPICGVRDPGVGHKSKSQEQGDVSC